VSITLVARAGARPYDGAGMRDSWTAAKVGLLVVVALVASWLVYRAVDERGGGDSGYTVWAVFKDASGLVPKSRVMVAGIQVGYIDTIRLWGSRARVDIRIREGVAIHDDASVAKKTASILGEAVLAINPGTATHPAVPDGARIATEEESPGTDAILANVARISDAVLNITRQMERTFGTDEGGRQMSSALANLSQALAAINETIRQNQDVIAHALQGVDGMISETAPQLARILENIERVTAEVRNVLGRNSGELDETVGGIGETVASVERSAAQLEGVLNDVRDVTGRTARGEGTLGRLTADETLVDEVQGVAEGVGDLVGGISRLQTIVQLRADYNFLANTMKSYVQLRLQPREDRYYYIELVNDPRGLTTYEQSEIIRSPPADGEPAVQQVNTVTTRDAFRFSLGLAKRIEFATFRFGVIESTGGVGLDLHFFDDDLEVTNDVFAFGERAYPRMRTNIAFQIISRLWILGGVDDYLNSSRDFYLGAALRFNDEDLKAILSVGGGAISGVSGGR
jgi:phospholipid/cholesterol/gamma-HCH transport system substrate-binding protein